MQQTVSKEKISIALSKLSDFKDCKIVHMGEGVSTEVYRLEGVGVNYYLRLKDPDESASAEVLAHKLMLEKEAKVPRVVYSRDFDEDLGRSFLVTSEVAGTPLRTVGGNTDSILYDAGKDLALINSVKLERFGWIDATKVYTASFGGDAGNYFTHMTGHVSDMLKELVASQVISDSLRNNYLAWFEIHNRLLWTIDQPVLAHGDFDLSHIYHKDGVYTGIIDFGDIRAVSMYHDLAHFYLYVPDKFDALIAGYRSITVLPKDYLDYVQLEATLLGFGKLWWMLKNTPDFTSKVEKLRRPLLVVLGKVLPSPLI